MDVPLQVNQRLGISNNERRGMKPLLFLLKKCRGKHLAHVYQ